MINLAKHQYQLYNNNDNFIKPIKDENNYIGNTTDNEFPRDKSARRDKGQTAICICTKRPM